jgi:hypothetical protein
VIVSVVCVHTIHFRLWYCVDCTDTPTVFPGCVFSRHIQYSGSHLTVSRNITLGQDDMISTTPSTKSCGSVVFKRNQRRFLLLCKKKERCQERNRKKEKGRWDAKRICRRVSWQGLLDKSYRGVDLSSWSVSCWRFCMSVSCKPVLRCVSNSWIFVRHRRCQIGIFGGKKLKKWDVWHTLFSSGWRKGRCTKFEVNQGDLKRVILPTVSSDVRSGVSCDLTTGRPGPETGNLQRRGQFPDEIVKIEGAQIHYEDSQTY